VLPVPFSEWVTSAECYWVTLAERPSAGGMRSPRGAKPWV